MTNVVTDEDPIIIEPGWKLLFALLGVHQKFSLKLLSDTHFRRLTSYEDSCNANINLSPHIYGYFQSSVDIDICCNAFTTSHLHIGVLARTYSVKYCGQQLLKFHVILICKITEKAPDQLASSMLWH